MSKFLTLGGCLLLGGALLVSCGPEKQANERASQVIPKALSALSYSPREGLTPESVIHISVAIADTATATPQPAIDSVAVSWNGQHLLTAPNTQFPLELAQLQAGKQQVSATVYLSNGENEKHTLHLTVFSPTPPEHYTYRKVGAYTHDPDAYTQGLLVHNGFFYESTGQKGKSTLRKVEPATGKVLRQINLEDQYFGEGITIFNGKIYQLTYQSNTGFVYDLETFEKLNTFHYPTEGWGLAALGGQLIMTDGSENIYFMDPGSFVEMHRIEVYTHTSKVDQLNELEIIDGKIYANVYQTDRIVIIDPETGFVEGEVNLEGIFNTNTYDRKIDVLNGIAWDEHRKALYITGKWWPRLFQIELLKIQS